MPQVCAAAPIRCRHSCMARGGGVTVVYCACPLQPSMSSRQGGHANVPYPTCHCFLKNFSSGCCACRHLHRRRAGSRGHRGSSRGGPCKAAFADPNSKNKYDATPDLSAQPILLFDLNGTLTPVTLERWSIGKNSARPGTAELLRLKPYFR